MGHLIVICLSVFYKVCDCHKLKILLVAAINTVQPNNYTDHFLSSLIHNYVVKILCVGYNVAVWNRQCHCAECFLVHMSLATSPQLLFMQMFFWSDLRIVSG